MEQGSSGFISPRWNINKFKEYLVDILLVLAFLWLPGIRGYEYWQVHEYLFLAAALLYILFLRHSKAQPVEKSP